VGSLRMRVPLEELRRNNQEPAGVSAESHEKKHTEDVAVTRNATLHASPGMELDLRGMMSEDALDKLEAYLDKASLAGMPFVRIIHGKGTGKLRMVVRHALKDHPHVKSFEEGGEKEGGEGVTVAKLKE
jgi:DNA mismatch repair protein MutS2